VREALGIQSDENALAWLDGAAASRQGGVDRAVRAGFEELFTDAGPRHLDGRARREAVVRALSFALVTAAAQAKSGAAVVVVEQLHRTDTATLAALTTLTSQSINAAVLLIGTHTSRADPRWLNSEVIVLHGLKREQAGAAISGVLGTPGADVSAALDAAGEDVPPLYLDQLARWSLEGGGPAPARVVDLVSARFERLPPRARRAVQVLSLLGEADGVLLGKVLGEEFDALTSTALRLQGWVELDADGATTRYRLAHALVREVAEASIPSVARSELHEKCAEVLVNEPVPMEARALHASYAEDPFQALILLERVGDRAIARGDDLGAAHALRRGLERARRELMRGELDEPERAMAIFARKLGDALIRAGEAAEAEGVLSEGLELLSRSSVDWARLQGSLARALYARGRTPDALRAMDEAVKSARRLGARLAAVELIMARADLEGSLGNIVESVAQLRTAEELLLELMSESNVPGRRTGAGSAPPAGDEQAQRLRIEVLVRLSRGLRQVGEEMAAGEPLLEARELADKLGLVLERARCDAEGAERAEQLGDFRAAAHAWRRATHGARDAGDVVAEAQYHERASRLPRVIAQSAG
jgi:tetratricopeptide (TPR) repeat protein